MNRSKAQGELAQAMPLRVRDRIFATARELFSRQGIRAVGVDAITCGAGTNKMSFYRSFASKDALICECVRAQQAEYRSEEHTSELQSLMRISYAVFCLKKKIKKQE